MEGRNKSKNSNSKIFNSEEFYEDLITKAPFIPGDEEGCVIEMKDVNWIDPILIKEGQDFIRKYFYAETTVMISSFLLGVTFKGVTTVLLRTSGYSSISKSRRRNVETAIHIRNWLAGINFGDFNDIGFRGLQKVRSMHLAALHHCERNPLIINEDEIEDRDTKMKIIEALQKDLHFLDTTSAPQHLFTYTPKQLFSQFDMAMVLFGMYAPIFLFPEKFGIRNTKSMKGYLHFWAVIGRGLGIRDEFNVALHPDKELQIKIFTNIIIPSIKNLDLTQLYLGTIFLESIYHLPLYGLWGSYSSLLYTGLMENPLFNGKFTGDNLYKLTSWRDIIMYKITIIITKIIYYIPIPGEFFNYIIHIKHNNAVLKHKIKVEI